MQDLTLMEIAYLIRLVTEAKVASTVTDQRGPILAKLEAARAAKVANLPI